MRMSSKKAGKPAEGEAAKALEVETASAEAPAEEKMSFSLLWKRYGAVAVGTHFGVYFATLAGLFVAVKNGALGATEEERLASVEKAAGILEPYAPASVVAAIRTSPDTGQCFLFLCGSFRT